MSKPFCPVTMLAYCDPPCGQQIPSPNTRPKLRYPWGVPQPFAMYRRRCSCPKIQTENWRLTLSSVAQGSIRLRWPSPLLLAASVILSGASGVAQVSVDKGQQNPLKTMSLEQLGDVEVTTVSKEPEPVWNTPAAIYVISQDDIRRSGARNIPEALRLAPGVEVARITTGEYAIGIRGFNSRLSRSVL